MPESNSSRKQKRSDNSDSDEDKSTKRAKTFHDAPTLRQYITEQTMDLRAVDAEAFKQVDTEAIIKDGLCNPGQLVKLSEQQWYAYSKPAMTQAQRGRVIHHFTTNFNSPAPAPVTANGSSTLQSGLGLHRRPTPHNQPNSGSRRAQEQTSPASPAPQGPVKACFWLQLGHFLANIGGLAGGLVFVLFILFVFGCLLDSTGPSIRPTVVNLLQLYTLTWPLAFCLPSMAADRLGLLSKYELIVLDNDTMKPITNEDQKRRNFGWIVSVLFFPALIAHFLMSYFSTDSRGLIDVTLGHVMVTKASVPPNQPSLRMQG